jgi:hypothetical protein
MPENFSLVRPVTMGRVCVPGTEQQYSGTTAKQTMESSVVRWMTCWTKQRAWRWALRPSGLAGAGL